MGVRESVSEIAKELEAKVSRSEVDPQVEKIAEDALEYAKSIAPVRTGRFRESLRMHQIADNRGFARFRVDSTDDPAKVGSIEYGTDVTPEFAVFEKTSDHLSEKG